jgi:hypothetical protein
VKRTPIVLLAVLAIVLVVGGLWTYRWHRDGGYWGWANGGYPHEIAERFSTVPASDRPRMARELHSWALDYAAGRPFDMSRDLAPKMLLNRDIYAQLGKAERNEARRALIDLLSDPRPIVEGGTIPQAHNTLFAVDERAWATAAHAKDVDRAMDAACAAAQAKLKAEME